MYVIGLFLVLAILLGAVMTVLDSILDTLRIGDAVRKLPIIGSNLALIIAILMMKVLEAHVLERWGYEAPNEWLDHIVEGSIVWGMIPVKDAIVNAINKGLRA